MIIGLPLKKFYHCKLKHTENHKIKEYHAPILKRGNYQPLSGYLDVLTHGKDIQNKWRLIVNMSQRDEYAIGDLLYLDGAKPVANTENGEGANAVISYIGYGNFAITIEIDSIISKR
jgi:hypothetical protein